MPTVIQPTAPRPTRATNALSAKWTQPHIAPMCPHCGAVETHRLDPTARHCGHCRESFRFIADRDGWQVVA